VEVKITGTRVFEENFDAWQEGTRFVVNQGGTGSSKTYSLAQLFLYILLKGDGVTMTIVRKTLPALKATAIHDLFEIMKEQDIYSLDDHNKSDFIYEMHGNRIVFFG